MTSTSGVQRAPQAQWFLRFGAAFVLAAAPWAACSGGGGGGGEEPSGGSGGMAEGGMGGGSSEAGGMGGADEGAAGGAAGEEAVGGMGGAQPAGGSGGSGGNGGSGGAAQGGTGGTKNSDCPGFCEDFEGFDLGEMNALDDYITIDDPEDRYGGNFVIDGERSVSGGKSMKVTVVGAESSRARISKTSSLVPRGVLGGGDIYSRMMIYSDNDPSGNLVHWDYMSFEGTLVQGGRRGKVFHSVGGERGKLFNLFLWPTGQSLDEFVACEHRSNTDIPFGRWFCLEAHINADNNSFEVWLDGERVDDASYVDKPDGARCSRNGNFLQNGEWTVPSKIFGMTWGFTGYFFPQGTTNHWIDDIQISTERIGCPDMNSN